jgi:hypothetical protein
MEWCRMINRLKDLFIDLFDLIFPAFLIFSMIFGSLVLFAQLYFLFTEYPSALFIIVVSIIFGLMYVSTKGD